MNRNAIMCINDGIIFEKPIIAAKYYFVTPAQLTRVLSGTQRLVMQRAFAYIPEQLNDPVELARFRAERLAEQLNITALDFDGLSLYLWTPSGLEEIY